MSAKLRISNISYLQKRVKDYAKPFRFTLSMLWEEPDGKEHGVDIIGCIAGVGRDGVSEWRRPSFRAGVKPVYMAHFAPGTYEKVLGALTKGGYFKDHLVDLFKPVPAEEEGLPGEINVE